MRQVFWADMRGLNGRALQFWVWLAALTSASVFLVGGIGIVMELS